MGRSEWVLYFYDILAALAAIMVLRPMIRGPYHARNDTFGLKHAGFVVLVQ